MTDLEFRAAQVTDVSYPQRRIDLVVMPYEQPTVVQERSRSYTEIVTRGAFGQGIAGRKDIRVNRDHDLGRTVGRAVKFHPSREDGLVAELKISRTPLGDESLELAADGLLDASAGFALLAGPDGKPVKDAEVWETRDRRRLNHLWLGHVALTPDPAYESAQVLAVRHAANEGQHDPLSRPNLERLEVERLRRVAADLDSRYLRG